MVREARVEKGLSQSELAFRIGMKQPDISMIEKGKNNITLETLTRLCKVLEIKKIEF
ncbi:MAG: helix-turn-helix transcriptional regulator [Candidatus Omnitrophica bacterium]|nr:helix-turn-helix transcriptional regulator [Candidatus Omnitrophota bacterium]